MTRRTSARGASAKKRYTVDAFEGIEGLQDSGSDHSPVRRSRDSDSGDEFHIESEPADAAEEDEDDFSGADDEPEGHSVLGSDAGEQDLDDAMSIAGDDDLEPEDDDDHPAGHKRTPNRKPKIHLSGPDGLLYNRGLPDSVTRRSGKFDKRLFLFGSSVREFRAVEKACFKWDGQDALPARRKLQEPASKNCAYSYWQGEDARKREEEEGWKPYFEGGLQGIFTKRQSMKQISQDEGRARVAADELPSRTFLIGPVNSPQLITLHAGESTALNRAWVQPQAEGFKAVPKHASATKAGFILNLGVKVKCVEWAPNQPGSSQYLATSTLPRRETLKGSAPAFTPQNPDASEIQIWEFKATKQGSLDSEVAPVLKHVLCTEWGDAKALRWCPAPHRRSTAPGSTSIGLLAGVWGDGGLRVIDLMNMPDSSTTQYTKVEKAAFESHPPDTLFTRLTWSSATRISAGCANGCVAVFDLTKTSVSEIPRPSIYTSVASGYILSITSCYPSHQNLFLTTSADGYPRLTDLNDPMPGSPSGTILGPRSRSTQDIIAWHEFSQIAIVMDDNFALKALPLRRFFTTIALGRAKTVGTSLAVSPCHPFILMGTANGEITGSNPMRRIIQPKALPLLQVWFMHEWRRPTQPELEGQQSTPKPVGNNGLSRFVEGFKVEQGQRTYREGSMQNSDDKDHGLHFHTVHEEETGVSAMSWNPNKECGTWAAAGLASGLLRVEDLAAC
ncbi:hypothetical protein WHR41_00139 [Cladosporium halotolerans]|uniref:Transcription factor TFIIIC complex subunit Tfc6 n=1 Tax=Cladosporium halotolerans TaxID=1052096 RepID=A0AB34L1S3_9PEZI